MRTGKIERKTKETHISLTINLDGTGEYSIETGIGFFNHMLEGFAKHGFFDLELRETGDLIVDEHHTIEDCGIALGEGIKAALGDKKGITRYGYCIIPMDEVLVLVSLDLCGRPYLSYDMDFPTEMVGDIHCDIFKEFFYAISYSCGMNLHIKLLSPGNSHHIIEAVFKAFSKALDMAVATDSRIKDTLSTKGCI